MSIKSKGPLPNTGEIIEDTLEMLKRYQKAKNNA
jgi:hypothetical protein